MATSRGGCAAQRYSLGTRQADGALVAVEEDTAAVAKLLLMSLVAKSCKVVIACLLERKKSKRKNSPCMRPDVDMHAGKKAT